ncbi:auxin efflux carrier [Myriangium duriaei CBS 260.36]|uniref:Auxin efflux carrier n=1 Tax=Myriangium duriaei CBS 260.36 TaxID=1168546 RepID=A0A9P4IQZ3_9PEZI|nr:auxin efflux carrier [Myriangium duriaei CBS 260.36]
MAFFSTPTAFRLRDTFAEAVPASVSLFQRSQIFMADQTMGVLKGHSSHPNFGHLVLLVFEAVLEVVCVSLPGYIVARQGMFDADAQKFVANLNVQLFTPCLVFTKLASQLNADKLLDLAVIPVIFAVQTLVSWACSLLISKLCRFPKRQTNFVTAMGVFGNSNSLPISLVISLSKTLSGLHWDQIPGDNDEEVAARGILYLLIFQQLGQLLRWSWGYNVLLKPAESDEQQEQIEQGRYRDDPEDEESDQDHHKKYNSDYGSGSQSPHTISSVGSSASLVNDHPQESEEIVTPANGNIVHRGTGNMAGHGMDRSRSLGHITQFPSYNGLSNQRSNDSNSGLKASFHTAKAAVQKSWRRTSDTISTFFSNLFRKLPVPVQKFLRQTGSYIFRFFNAIYQSMNPPLWAMLAAVIVASVPALQRLFFKKGTFINNSVTHAIAQSGGVAVPLILVVLGANLARNTLPQEELAIAPEEKKEERKLLYAALVARMLLPTLFIAPFLAVFAKFVPVSILDDPIFIVVCFLLTGAPSALQLAQICQLNNVFMGVMSKLLFQSYVIWILPSTLMLVMLALETVEWANATS